MTGPAAEAKRQVTVVRVDLDAEPRVGSCDGWWDVPIAEVSGEASVNEARAEYEEAAKQQREVW